MKQNWKKLAAFMLAAVLLAGLLTACGGKKPDERETQAVPTLPTLEPAGSGSGLPGAPEHQNGETAPAAQPGGQPDETGPAATGSAPAPSSDPARPDAGTPTETGSAPSQSGQTTPSQPGQTTPSQPASSGADTDEDYRPEAPLYDTDEDMTNAPAVTLPDTDEDLP